MTPRTRPIRHRRGGDPRPGVTFTLEIAAEDSLWEEAAPEIRSVALAAARAALAAADMPADGCEISLLLCDDARICALNGAHRGRAKPTNVLSWPSFPLAPSEPGAAPPPPPRRDGEVFLGDVALARETCAREAEAGAKRLRDHAAHLIAHGTLHLLGYDHETDADAAVMEALERRAMAELGIADPYA